MGRTTGPARRSSKEGWTEELDKILAAAVEKFNHKSWKKIAECVPGRTDVQCLHRWQKVLNPNLVKGPWTKEEDEIIIQLVGKHGTSHSWSKIAKQLSGRMGKQCRERWYNHLDPSIKRTAWTVEEERILVKVQGEYGNKWAEIAKFLPGRTENSIKNHWNCSLKKKVRSQQSSDYRLCSYGKETDCVKTEADKQGIGRTLSLEKIIDRCSQDLVIEKDSNEEEQKSTSNEDGCLFPAESPLSMSVVRKSGSTAVSLAFSLSTPCNGPAADTEDDVYAENQIAQPLENEEDGTDLNISLATVPDNNVQQTSPASCATPASYCRSSPNHSPESILRIAARSFKNTPSIIRKRSCRVSVRDTESLPRSKPEELIGSAAKRSVGKCLEYTLPDDFVGMIIVKLETTQVEIGGYIDAFDHKLLC